MTTCGMTRLAPMELQVHNAIMARVGPSLRVDDAPRNKAHKALLAVAKLREEGERLIVPANVEPESDRQAIINASSVFSTRRSSGRRRRRVSEGWNIRNGHTASWQSGVNNQEVTAYPVLTSDFRAKCLSDVSI